MRIRFYSENTELLKKIEKAIGRQAPVLDRIKIAAQANFDWYLNYFNTGMQKILSEARDAHSPRPRGSTEWWCKHEIRLFYRLAIGEGRKLAGNLDILSEWEEKEIRKLRSVEYKFLIDFLDDIDEGLGVMSYQRRMQMYADAMKGVYWLGFVIGNRDPRRRIRWVISPAEHCSTCISLNGRVWTARGFLKWYRRYHILPAKGTKCLSNCKCHLEEYFTNAQPPSMEEQMSIEDRGAAEYGRHRVGVTRSKP